MSPFPPRSRSLRRGRRGAVGSTEPRRRRRVGGSPGRGHARGSRVPAAGRSAPGPALSGRRHSPSPPPSVTDTDTRSGPPLPAAGRAARAGRDSSSGRRPLRPRHLQAPGSVPQHLSSRRRGRGCSVLRAALRAPGALPRRQAAGTRRRGRRPHLLRRLLPGSRGPGGRGLSRAREAGRASQGQSPKSELPREWGLGEAVVRATHGAASLLRGHSAPSIYSKVC